MSREDRLTSQLPVENSSGEIRKALFAAESLL